MYFEISITKCPFFVWLIKVWFNFKLIKSKKNQNNLKTNKSLKNQDDVHSNHKRRPNSHQRRNQLVLHDKQDFVQEKN